MSDVKKDHSNHACCHRRKCPRGHVIIPYDVTCVKLRAEINGMSFPARLVADTMFYCLQGSHQKFEELFSRLTQSTCYDLMKAQAPPPLSGLHPFKTVSFFFMRPVSAVFKFWKETICIAFLYKYVQMKHPFLSILWQTIWADGQTAKFGQLLFRQPRQAAQFSTPTGSSREFHHLCWEFKAQ